MSYLRENEVDTSNDYLWRFCVSRCFDLDVDGCAGKIFWNPVLGFFDVKSLHHERIDDQVNE